VATKFIPILSRSLCLLLEAGLSVDYKSLPNFVGRWFGNWALCPYPPVTSLKDGWLKSAKTYYRTNQKLGQRQQVLL